MLNAPPDLSDIMRRLGSIEDLLGRVDSRTRNPNELTAFDAAGVLVGPGIGIKAGSGISLSRATGGLIVVAGAATDHHVYSAVVDGSTGSTLVPFAVCGPFPHAGTVQAVHVKAAENKTNGATAWIGDVHKVVAASQDTDGQGMTVYTTQANRPTLTNGHMAQTAPLPDVTAFAVGDWLLYYSDQAGTNLTYVTISVEVLYA